MLNLDDKMHPEYERLLLTCHLALFIENSVGDGSIFLISLKCRFLIEGLERNDSLGNELLGKIS